MPFDSDPVTKPTSPGEHWVADRLRILHERTRIDAFSPNLWFSAGHWEELYERGIITETEAELTQRHNAAYAYLTVEDLAKNRLSERPGNLAAFLGVAALEGANLIGVVNFEDYEIIKQDPELEMEIAGMISVAYFFYFRIGNLLSELKLTERNEESLRALQEIRGQLQRLREYVPDLITDANLEEHLV